MIELEYNKQIIILDKEQNIKACPKDIDKKYINEYVQAAKAGYAPQYGFLESYVASNLKEFENLSEIKVINVFDEDFEESESSDEMRIY